MNRPLNYIQQEKQEYGSPISGWFEKPGLLIRDLKQFA
jgi:hypothetical protein